MTDRVLRKRPGVGKAYLFPSPRNARRVVSKDLARRKDLPDVDVAAAGGWSDLTSLKTAYQQPDMTTLYRVVSEPAELREERKA